MSALVPLAYAGLPLLVLIFFRVLPRHQAVIWIYMLSIMFLPRQPFEVLGVIHINPRSAASFMILAWIAAFDMDRLLAFRPRWFDVPFLFWMPGALFTSLSNDLGAWDGLSTSVMRIAVWVAPYFIARIYFRDRKSLQDLAWAVFLGALIYVPLAGFEIRMSPQLHRLVYGFDQHNFTQTARGTGYWRPMVFMQHGLMVAMWMGMCTVVVWAMFREKMGRFLRVPFWLWAGGLTLTTIACQSFGAVILLIAGFGTVLACRLFRRPWPYLLLALAPSTYCILRATDAWDAQNLIDGVEAINADRAYSLSVRIAAESTLTGHARDRLWLGWGGFGRFRTTETQTNEKGVLADSMWLITFSQNGLFGLLCLLAMHFVGCLVVAGRAPPQRWLEPRFALPGSMALVISLVMVDNLMNNMINPVFLVILGAVVGPGSLPDEETAPQEESPPAEIPAGPRILGT